MIPESEKPHTYQVSTLPPKGPNVMALASLAFPQVLLCILAVVAIFIFILATLICCLLRFVGPDGAYCKLDSTEKNLQEQLLADEECYYEEDVKPTLIYHTLDFKSTKDTDNSSWRQSQSTLCDDDPQPQATEAGADSEAFFSMRSSCKLWRSWNSQVHNIALPTGNSAETQL